mmetsp:Transcript_21864/g.47677  ORF Transcript_21864/g.47677 Transcript_21864/m.47677 type:complete len:115 (+) Transcript_21864:3079-3423(+)
MGKSAANSIQNQHNHGTAKHGHACQIRVDDLKNLIPANRSHAESPAEYDGGKVEAGEANEDGIEHHGVRPAGHGGVGTMSVWGELETSEGAWGGRRACWGSWFVFVISFYFDFH